MFYRGHMLRCMDIHSWSTINSLLEKEISQSNRSQGTSGQAGGADQIGDPKVFECWLYQVYSVPTS